MKKSTHVNTYSRKGKSVKGHDKFITIRDGTQRVEMGSKQAKFLWANHIPLSVVDVTDGKEHIHKFNTNPKTRFKVDN